MLSEIKDTTRNYMVDEFPLLSVVIEKNISLQFRVYNGDFLKTVQKFQKKILNKQFRKKKHRLTLFYM